MSLSRVNTADPDADLLVPRMVRVAVTEPDGDGGPPSRMIVGGQGNDRR
jgi:hypothetical protein